MKISEQFDSIQGEGIHAGTPMSFIRLAGCNMSPYCVWCDTPYAQSDFAAQDIPVVDINPSRDWICITGGEPLAQQDELAGLVLKLKYRSRSIEIETNGSIPPPSWAFSKVDHPAVTRISSHRSLPLVDSWVVDIKLASSGNPSSLDVISRWSLGMRSSDQLKLVVANEADLDDADYWIPIVPRRQVIISPVMPCSQEWMERVAEFCIDRNVRLSLQLHKIIWGNKRGV